MRQTFNPHSNALLRHRYLAVSTLALLNAVAAQAADTSTVAASPASATSAASSPSATTQNETMLPAVKVMAPNAQEGSAAVGYKPETANTTGPWGKKPIKDTPYSITVVPSDLIENWVTNSSDQLYAMTPGVQLRQPLNYNDTQSFNIRGFTPAITYLDGVRVGINAVTTSLPLEEMDRVEILSGLSGFLYGGGNVGGAVNYVLKRPTTTPLADFTIGNYGGGQYFAHADLGGPIDKDGKLRYRLNIVTQPEGATSIENQRVKRNSVSGALDWDVTSKLLLQVEAGHSEFTIDGLTPTFTLPAGVSYSNVKLPSSNFLYDQQWTHREVTTNHAGINATWKATDNIDLRAGYLYKRDDFGTAIYNCSSNLNPNGSYSQSLCETAPQQFSYQGVYALADVNFNTAFVHHKVTLGYSADFGREYIHSDNFAEITIPGLSFSNPYVPELPFTTPVGQKPSYLLLRNYYKNLQIGDQIDITRQWEILAGVNRTTIQAVNETTTGTVTAGIASAYDESALTPTVSVLFKPTDSLTTYATYMQALQQGAIVGPNFENAGQVLSPVLTQQYEVGAKAALGGALVTGSLFRIREGSIITGFAHPTDKLQTETEDGRQVNQGFELDVSGKPLRNLTLWGGITAFTARTMQASTAALDGKVPIGVAEKMAKLYAEYDTPIPGLTLTGGVVLTGPSYADSANTNRVPGYAVANAGFRYETRELGKTFILRLDGYNLNNKRYWLTNGYIGTGRYVAFSLEAKL